jgi:hypothetical protein
VPVGRRRQERRVVERVRQHARRFGAWAGRGGFGTMRGRPASNGCAADACLAKWTAGRPNRGNIER